ncbi:MAG: hypothetical protein KDA28_01245, partial [Phycisphaerales bacterium]|nr:hypothetical protein [Phycisphaerales bacterium]
MRAVRTIIAVGGDALLAFHVVDDHVHLLLRGDRRATDELAARIRRALERDLGVMLADPRPSLVEGDRLARNRLEYVLCQNEEHNLDRDDALWLGSSLWDYLGLRSIDGYQPDVRPLVPWYRPRHALSKIGLPELKMCEAT